MNKNAKIDFLHKIYKGFYANRQPINFAFFEIFLIIFYTFDINCLSAIAF